MIGEFPLRPMRADEGESVYDVTMDAFAFAAERAHEEPPQREDRMLEAQRRRVAHSVAHDPEGCWIAESPDGRTLGVAIALLREDLWILSLLMVRGEAQGQGVGRALMDRALLYAEGRPKGIIAASSDPFAWRRYWGAGFRLHLSAMAKGAVQRAAIPAVPGVREGTAGHFELCHEVSRALRGSAHGPDLEYLAGSLDVGFWVSEAAGDRGFALSYRGSPSLVAAERPETAQRLLWTVLAEAQEDVAFYFVTGGQQWALDVSFAAGLLVRPGSGLFTRGDLGPLQPYLPNGPFL